VEDYAAAAHVAVDVLADYVAGARAGWQPVTARPDPDALARRLEVED
jgi:hypothetical protein